MEKITFALFFANRGFFPGELIAEARNALTRAVTQAGCDYILMEAEQTRYGAVETREEGLKYAAFLRENRGRYQGIIVCLPNFGDENGALAALTGCDVPIFVQACRDAHGQMDFAHRRDAVCGKFAMCSVLRQAGIRYTIAPPFATDLDEPAFLDQLCGFAGVCRTVAGMRTFNVGAIGARTTAFKSVRVDEITLQNNGVNVETIDLSEVFRRMKDVTSARIAEKKAQYLAITQFDFAEEKLETIARVGAVVDDLISELHLQAVALRCWDELELAYGVAPCLLLGELNERGIQAACEVDIGNAVMMRALALSSGGAPMLLDVNNNYGHEDDKCILFHCGPVPISLMEGKGRTIEHLMFAKSYGEGSGVGVNKGVIRRNIQATYGSAKTEKGKIYAFLGQGQLTGDPIEEEFFGTGVVLQAPYMQQMMHHMATEGYRHHMSVVSGHSLWAAQEALQNYLGYQVHTFE